MADDMDIEDLLEAPYKLAAAATADAKREEAQHSNGVESDHQNGAHAKENGQGANDADSGKVALATSQEDALADKDSSKSKEKKSHKEKSRKRSRSRSGSRSKKSKTKDKEKEKEKEKESSSSTKKKQRSRSRSRSKHRSSRSRSRSPRRRHSSRSNSRDRHRRSRYSPRRRSPEFTPEERDVRTVFVMQLSNRIRPRDLEDFFSSVGKVRDVRLITDPRTKRSKGIAYIEFRDVDSVNLAIALTGQRLLGVPIMIKPSQAEKNRMPLQLPNQQAAVIPQEGPMKLYIGSLHVNINEEMLQGIFEPFGKIMEVCLAKDDFGRSKGYGFIQFANADDAKKALEQLNNFELANRPMKVAPFIEKPLDGNATISNLDNDELDRAGVNLGPSGKLALMAKLAEGSGIKLPQSALDALSMSTSLASANTLSVNSPSPMSSQCFMLSNMFDLAEELKRPDWTVDICDDVIEECTKFGGVVHIHVDQKAPEGVIYVKCPTIAVAVSAMTALNGRFFAGKQIQTSFIPIAIYNQQFPDSMSCTKLLKASST